MKQGKTRDEALANIREAVAPHVEVLQERGEPVPTTLISPEAVDSSQ